MQIGRATATDMLTGCMWQVGKKIADIWKGLPDNEKEGYKQRAGEAKAEYDQANPKQPKQARCVQPRRHCSPCYGR